MATMDENQWPLLAEPPTSSDFNFLTKFAEELHTEVFDDRISIPDKLGSGFIRKIDLAPDYKLLIHRYILKEDLVIKRVAPDYRHDLINIIFSCNEQTSNIPVNENPANGIKGNYAIQIASSDLELEVCFPADIEIFYTVIGIRAEVLQKLLMLDTGNYVVQKIISNTSGFIFHEEMGLEIFKTLKQLTGDIRSSELNSFFYRIKVQELLFLLFKRLLLRTDNHHSPLNVSDIDKLYQVRTSILSDLGKPPVLKILSLEVGLSKTKLKDLFRQVFGESIYSYYQKFRMEQAAYLLREKRYSVAETGFQLGFINLSHFSRVFKKQYGTLPKKYSADPPL
jgi:AraC-like DNA-binding protein